MTLARLRRPALLAGLAGTALWLVALALDPVVALRALFVAWVAFVSLTAGALLALLVDQLAGGRRAGPFGRGIAAGTATLPALTLAGLLFLPLIPTVMPWAGELAGAEAVEAKAAYLNPAFFGLRHGAVLSIWTALAVLALRPGHRLSFAALGLVLFVPTAHVAAVDWLLSLDPAYNSSIVGLLYLSGLFAGGVALASLLAVISTPRGQIDGLWPGHRPTALSGLMLAAALLWAYHAGMQYLTYWSGNLPHHVEWYHLRSQGGFGALNAFVIAVHVALPLILLLPARWQTTQAALAAVAGTVLLARLGDVARLMAPAYPPETQPGPLALLSAYLAVGGLWSWCVLARFDAQGEARVTGEMVRG